jgi:glyoxylase-like metal-dependent hydrolase (beta-lactamase superfamily II)
MRGVTALLTPSPLLTPGTNCYIVGTGPKRILIDAAEDKFGNEAFMAALEECMEKIGCVGFQEILITHQHHDHFGGVHKLLEKYGADIRVRNA